MKHSVLDLLREGAVIVPSFLYWRKMDNCYVMEGG